MKNINVKYYFFLLSGLLIASYIFYIRVILTRLPREITFEWNIWSFLLYTGLSLLFLYILKKQIYPNESKNKIIKKIKEYTIEKIHYWYTSSLSILFSALLQKIGESVYTEIDQIAFMRKIRKILLMVPMQRSLMIVTILYFGPRFILGIAFLIDIYYYHYFFYFYKIMWLLIIPILWKIVYSYIDHKYDAYILMINQYFIITLRDDENKKSSEDTIHRIITYTPILSETVTKVQQDFFIGLYQDPIFDLQHFFIGIYNGEGTMNNLLLAKILKISTSIMFLFGFLYLAFGYGITYFGLFG